MARRRARTAKRIAPLLFSRPLRSPSPVRHLIQSDTSDEWRAHPVSDALRPSRSYVTPHIRGTPRPTGRWISIDPYETYKPDPAWHPLDVFGPDYPTEIFITPGTGLMSRKTR